nr:hypothetical protein [Candidatus Njordarchaeota archaeon]
MTLVLALKWGSPEQESVLVAFDSKATTPFGIAYEVKKVYPVFLDAKPVGMASGAGDEALVKWGFETVDDVLLKLAKQESPDSFEAFRKGVREVESRFVKRSSELRNLGVTPGFQLILCGLDAKGKASIYLFDERGLADPRHDSPGYAIIGSGFVTGGTLLLRLLGYKLELDLGILTAFILDRVSDVDSTVGPFVGESYLMRISEEKEGRKEIHLGPLTDEALIEYKDKSNRRKELIQQFWQLCDDVREEKVWGALKSLSIEESEETN